MEDTGRREPDWKKLHNIANRAEQESQKPGWNLNKWQALCDEATEASNGNGQLTEFMASYMPL